MKKKIIFFTLKKRSFYDFFSARGVQKVRLHFSSLIYRIYQKKYPKKTCLFGLFLRFLRIHGDFSVLTEIYVCVFQKKKVKFYFWAVTSKKLKNKSEQKKILMHIFSLFFRKKRGKRAKIENMSILFYFCFLFFFSVFCWLPPKNKIQPFC